MDERVQPRGLNRSDIAANLLISILVRTRELVPGGGFGTGTLSDGHLEIVGARFRRGVLQSVVAEAINGHNFWLL